MREVRSIEKGILYIANGDTYTADTTSSRSESFIGVKSSNIHRGTTIAIWSSCSAKRIPVHIT